MNWPNNNLLVVLIGAVVAIVVPWLIPRAWCKFIIVPLLVPCIASLLWLRYEQHLNLISLPGDPLIRVDLLLIVPLIALDWFSAAASVAVAQIRSLKSKPAEAK